MKDFIPLIQTILWIFFSLVIIVIMRKEIRIILNIFNERLHSGSEFKIGPVEVGVLRNKIDSVEKEVSIVNDKVSVLFLLTMAEPMYINLKK